MAERTVQQRRLTRLPVTALRLHPPLILLLRAATRELEIEDYQIPANALVGVSPAISNRIAEDFPDPDSFAPHRYADPRTEDLVNRWTWIWPSRRTATAMTTPKWLSSWHSPVAEGERAAVTAAIRYCPTQALRVVD